MAKKQNPGQTFDQIIRLNCPFQHLTNLEGIKQLTNLQELSCGNNQLTSLDGIGNLTNLKYLYCHRNQLTNLEGIENLINLERLVCYGNNFSDDYVKYLRNYCKEKKVHIVVYTLS